jgi:heme/copper-type cytochrome/quinol oxidase subunit 3
MLKKSWLVLSSRRDLYRSKLVFHLFLLSLTVFFAAGMLAYLIIRANAFRRADDIPYVTLQVPTAFWISTGLLFLVSFSLHYAVNSIHRNRMQPFHRALGVALVAALAFTMVQAIGLQELLTKHLSASDGSTKSFGICFTIAFLHALHVIGGMGFLGYVIAQAAQQRYDHEKHWTVDNCASYWHFLDAVWIVMLVTFFIAR